MDFDLNLYRDLLEKQVAGLSINQVALQAVIATLEAQVKIHEQTIDGLRAAAEPAEEVVPDVGRD